MDLELSAAIVDLDSGRVTRGEQSLHLTPSERELLAFLVRHPRVPVARDTLLQSVWGYDKRVRTRTLDTTMKTLRKKVERDPRQPEHLRTVRGVGYQFVPQVVASERLVGRDDLLQRTLDELQVGAVVTLVGVAGVGKTSLGLEVLRHRRGVFASVETATTTDELLQALAAALAVGRSVDGVADLVHHLGRQTLEVLVVDNAEQAVDALATVLGPLAAVVPLLVTSRVPLGMPSERAVRLEGLATTDAVALLRRRVGPSYAEADGGALQAIVERLDGLPLAIELVSARARWLTPQDVVARLDDPTGLMPSGPGRHGSMNAALAWSYGALGQAAAHALSACTLFAGRFDVPALESTLDQATGDVVDALGELVDAGWVRRDEAGSLRMLVLLRADAARRRPAGPELVERAARHLVGVAAGAEGTAAVQWVDTARRLAGQVMDDDLSAELELVVDAAYASTGPTEARRAAAERALARAVRPDLRARAYLARAESGAVAGQGPFLDDLDAARALATEAGDRALLAQIVGRKGTVLLLRDHLDEAEPLLEQALALHRDVGDRRAVPKRQSNLAMIALRRGRFAVAKQRFLEALAGHEEVGNALSAARVMSSLGIVHLRMQRPKRARRWYESAAEAYAAVNHLPGLVRVEGNLGGLQLEEGQLDAADATFARAVARCRDIGEPLLEGIAWLNRASIALERGDTVGGERAVASARRSLGRVEAAGNLAVLDVVEVLLDWQEAPDPEALRRALDALPAMHRRLEVACRGVLVPFDGLVDAGDDEMLARWLALCAGGDREAMAAFVAGDAARDQEIRMAHAAWAGAR